MYAQTKNNFLTRSTQWLSVVVALIVDYLAKSLPQQNEPFLDERADLMQTDLYSDPHLFIWEQKT